MAQKALTKTRKTNALKAAPPRSAPANGESDAPLYLQVARSLKGDILSGIYPVGSQLPTEDDLCERFLVSRHTVREALRRLREDSLVSSRQGVGTIVVPPRASDSYLHAVNSINDLITCGTDTHFDLDSIKMVTIDGDLASRTNITGGGEWLAVSGFRFAEGAELPFCWMEYYINRDFAAVGRLLQRHNGAIFRLIEDLFGQTIVEVQEEIFAGVISPSLATGLKVEPGSAVLEVRDLYKTADGKTAQVTISTLPASRYSHSVTLRRVKS